MISIVLGPSVDVAVLAADVKVVVGRPDEAVADWAAVPEIRAAAAPMRYDVNMPAALFEPALFLLHAPKLERKQHPVDEREGEGGSQ